MAQRKIDPDELQRLIDDGASQAECARHFGVSETAVYLRLKKTRQLTSRVVALERAGALVDQKLSANERLERVQRVIDRELTWAAQEAVREGADRTALQDTILKLTAEVRQQLGLQLAISRALVDMRVVREFQQTVVDGIRAEAPETARRILAQLKERRALRPSASIQGLEADDGSLD